MRKLMVMAAVVAVAGAASATGVTAQDYVQNGLIAHWDGVENAGYGVHDATATEWKNLCGTNTVGDLPVAPLPGYVWRGTALEMTKAAGGTKDTTRLLTPEAVALPTFTIEMVASAPDGVVRRWEVCPWAQSFESWATAAEGYLERIKDTRIAALSTLRPNQQLQFITTYDGTTHKAMIYDNGTLLTKTKNVSYSYNGRLAFGTALAAKGRIYAIRVYNRALTSDEVAANYAVDVQRFAHYTWTGAVSSDWSDAGNWSVGGVTAPAAPTVDDAAVIPAGSSVTLDVDTDRLREIVISGEGTVTVDGAHVMLADAVSLDSTVTLALAADTAVAGCTVSRGGTSLTRNIYTGSGSGEQVAWISGSGALRVAGAAGGVIPSIWLAPTADGWYEFGLTSGYSYAYNGTKDTPYYGKHYIIGAHPIWNDYVFPAGAKLRLVGGILLETVPAGWFSEYDMSGLKLVFVNGTRAFADGTKLTVPSGCTFRCQPHTWALDESVANKWWCTAASSSPLTYTDDLENNGTHTIHGDGTQTACQIFSGNVTGNGTLNISSFSKQGRFTGGYAARLKLTGASNGCAVWFDTTTITGGLSTATLAACSVSGGNGKYGTNNNYCAYGLLFGKHNSDATADHELEVDTLTGNGNDTTDIPSGIRWRHGGHAIIWGNNTLHVGELKSGLHVVARTQDQRCSNGWIKNAVCKGIGNIVIDKFTSGNLYGSTNINVLVGQVASSSTKFDYTFQSGAINRMTLDITNGCPAGATVKATDIGMLPARISGFKGTVTLTDTATKSYTMPIDFTHGTNTLYNTTGCIGSGTLGSAPASGTINATFPTTGDAPVKGEYALARFTSGGDLLAGWTVTLNGQAVDSAIVSGMKVSVVKDATGLWLKVDKPGVAFIIR